MSDILDRSNTEEKGQYTYSSTRQADREVRFDEVEFQDHSLVESYEEEPKVQETKSKRTSFPNDEPRVTRIGLKETLTAAEVAKCLNVSTSTVYNMIKSGDLFAIKRGGRYVIDYVSLKQNLERKRKGQKLSMIIMLTGTVIVLLYILLVYFYR